MRTSRLRLARRAFTLIEILIVVVILGILAAIVIPQFTDASQEAMESNVLSTLQTLRSQIELYNVENPANAFDAATPTGATFWDPLLTGDYIQVYPKNPLQDGSTVVSDNPGAGIGWVWAEPPSMAGWGVNIFAVDENDAYADFDGDGDPD